ncbi:putative Lytic transglycosylase-like [Legionella fallonii LLAP-10]|uniref:Putative Lytic transglycosylase-like n=2 Tax=Legionella fallonii TaxID=96230 RepID=A0A098G227_9GAMM|nr:putative Lytic transglycosylase-like [Legionella fallonii LLAP-10]
MDELSVSKAFSISSAAQLMEQNALSQSISLSLQKHQHFDWEQLAVSGVTAGLMGGALGSKLDKTLRGLDHNTGMLSSELRALTNAGLNSAVAGSQLNALDVLQDNLGAAIGSAITDKRSELEQSQITGKDLARLKLKEIDEMDEYCPIPTEEGAYSPIPEGTYERFHQEILAHQRAALEQEEQDNYEARELSGSEGYESAQPHLSNQQTLSLGNYERLSLDSDLFKSSNDGVKELNFESKVYWSFKEHEGSNTIAGIKLKGLEWRGHSREGQYDINYDELLVKQHGSAYKKDEVVDKSYYFRTPGSPVWGYASRETQIETIDALITSAIEHELSLRDTAHVLVIARHESGFNPYAAAGSTTASGLGQFVEHTGDAYGINGSTRWNIKVQADALVSHFIDNKALVKQRKLTESYIYKFHHDGPTRNYGGLALSMNKIMPKIGSITHAIHKIF